MYKTLMFYYFVFFLLLICGIVFFEAHTSKERGTRKELSRNAIFYFLFFKSFKQRTEQKKSEECYFRNTLTMVGGTQEH